jgi:hypothetical protein
VLSVVPKASISREIPAPPPLVTPPPLMSQASIASLPGATGSFVAPIAPIAVVAPVPVKRGLPRITRGRAIGAALYVLTICAIKLDERYFFIERLMLPSDVIKEATEVQRVERPRLQAAQAKARALASVPAAIPAPSPIQPARAKSVLSKTSR